MPLCHKLVSSTRISAGILPPRDFAPKIRLQMKRLPVFSFAFGTAFPSDAAVTFSTLLLGSVILLGSAEVRGESPVPTPTPRVRVEVRTDQKFVDFHETAPEPRPVPRTLAAAVDELSPA